MSSIDNKDLSYDVQQIIFKATIFQASAVLEEYIKNVFEDWIYLIEKKKKTSKDLPEELICKILILNQEDMFKRYLITKDEKEAIKNMINKRKKILSIFNLKSKVKNTSYFNNLILDKKYPSPDNIINICFRFGINDIFDKVNRIGNKDYKKNLSSFNDIRTEIAHEDHSRGLTDLDVNEKLKSLNDFVEKFDKVMCSHVAKNTGGDCWNKKNIK